MAKVKLTEKRVKALLKPENYTGVSFNHEHSGSLDKLLSQLSYTSYVVKVDQGVKKRAKQGLLEVDVDEKKLKSFISDQVDAGYTNFLIEPVIRHDQLKEQYISFSNHRNGTQVLYSQTGGVKVEEEPDQIQKFLLKPDKRWSEGLTATNLPTAFLDHVEQVYKEGYFCFLEINPFVIENNEVVCLDAAATVDNAASLLTTQWNEADVVQKKKSDSEIRIAELARRSPASLNYSLLNPDGKIFTLLSGGGASLVVTDVFAKNHSLLGNYGEYSGSPTEEETYLYTKSVLTDLLASRAPKKALVIAGGVANFTDVETTFKGIVTALSECREQLKAHKVLVFVRRGGPNEKIGLKNLENFLHENLLLGSVHGSETSLEKPAYEALKYVTT